MNEYVGFESTWNTTFYPHWQITNGLVSCSCYCISQTITLSGLSSSLSGWKAWEDESLIRAISLLSSITMLPDALAHNTRLPGTHIARRVKFIKAASRDKRNKLLQFTIFGLISNRVGPEETKNPKWRRKIKPAARCETRSNKTIDNINNSY